MKNLANKQSRKLTDFYRRVHYWYDGLTELTSCWKTEEQTGIEYTPEERAKIHAAMGHLDTAQKLYSEIWSKRSVALAASCSNPEKAKVTVRIAKATTTKPDVPEEPTGGTPATPGSGKPTGTITP